jgi:Ca2+-binding EF-hand superfamily protein
MKSAFKSVDLDGSGSLDQQEVAKALATAGFQLEQKSFDTIFKKFDRNRKGSKMEIF